MLQATAADVKHHAQAAIAAAIRGPRARHFARQAIRGLRVPRQIWQRLPVDGGFDFELQGHRFAYSAALRDGVGRELFWGLPGSYEPETLSVLTQKIGSATTFFDVGANTGVFSLLAARANPQVRVHAFEPVRSVFAALQANVHTNGLDDRIVCVRSAVAERSGEIPLHIPDETWGNASLSARGFRGLTGQVERVPCTSLDDYVALEGIASVDIVKVDVEGFEHVVLGGARRLLHDHRPAVFAECLIETNTAAIDAILDEAGYQAFALTRHGPWPVGRIIPDPTEREKNFLFLPSVR